MKIQLLTFFTLLITCKSISQNFDSRDIEKSWIKYDIKMKDGSNLIDRFLTDSSYLKFTFKKDKLCQNSNPLSKVNESCFDFKRTKNHIRTSSTSGYIIEKITTDTLILLERIEGLDNDKLKRFFLESEEAIFQRIKKEKGSSKDQIASELYTPTQNKSLEIQLNEAFKRKHKNFKVRGEIKIDIQQEKVETKIFYSTTQDSKNINRIKNTIDSSFKFWNLEKFSDINSIKIPFVLKDENVDGYRGINLNYFTKSFYGLDNFYGGDTRIIQTAGQFFNKGIEAYQQKQYSNAIEFFTESYRLDPKNIDALYNRAALFFELNHKEMACNDWKELENLGQVRASELRKEHCQTSNNNG